MNQKTISKEFSLSGAGLHTGNNTNITFKPAPENTGVVFVRDDLTGKPKIHVDFNSVIRLVRGTTIGNQMIHIHTVEHILSALSALEIDNIYIHMNNSEPPALDGSAKPYVEAILQAGIQEQSSPKNYFELSQKVDYTDGDVFISAEPSDKFEVDFTISYDHPLIKNQRYCIQITPETFVKEIAPARTFCFDYEIEAIQSKGLGRGGDMSNTVVIGIDRIHNEDGLRFPDEFVRHKILDIIGDLYILGKPIKAKITAVKSGHKHNINFLKKLVSQHNVGKEDNKMEEIKAGEVIESAKIQKIIPHRYPMLLIDKVIINEPQKKATGYKSVSGNEPFFQGHFPGNPIMPGVLIVEAMAQASCVLFLSKPELSGKIAYFMSIENAKFRKPVLPGDNLEFKLEILKAKEKFGKARGEAFVNGTLVAESEFTFALVEK